MAIKYCPGLSDGSDPECAARRDHSTFSQMFVETEQKMMALAAAGSNRQILAMHGQRIQAQSKKTWLGVGRTQDHVVEIATEAQSIMDRPSAAHC